MGYEVKILIGTVSSLPEEEQAYFSEIARFDLCKVNLNCKALKGAGARLLERNDIISTHKIYTYNGDAKITEDLYGDELIAFDPEILLGELQDQMNVSSYRRFPPLVALLESLLATFGEKFYVVMFGH